jgi:hypothetical protein
MNLFSGIRGRLRSPDPAGNPRIAVFGDSHTAALIGAKEFPNRRDLYDHIRVCRLLKEKDGKVVGDTTLEDFCAEIRNYSAQDLVFSAIGGNQYAVVSTVRNPIEYDFLRPSEERFRLADGVALVPYRAIGGYIEKGVRGTMGPILKQIRAATGARVFHVAPPPPKQDNDFIATHFESRFAGQGIVDLGPTRPSLRLKCWKLQLHYLAELCAELGIGLVSPPKKGVTAKSFLDPRCYAKDVTHANRRYGEFVLKQMLELAGASAA